MRRARSSAPPTHHEARGAFRGTDRFELVRPLGEGGYGAVYEAHDRDHDQRVALKLLTRVGPEHVMRFKQEFRALQDLQHPNLVQLGELFEDDGRWFFTMELLHGVDFIDYVRGGKDARVAPKADNDTSRIGLPCDITRLRSVVSQLAEGVLALHSAGKVHRDIKPSNIQVTEDGRVVLLDFGLVTNSEGRQTTEALAVGTAAYMAPEQATGLPVGPPADWYGVGVVIYEALTGRLPFSGTAFEMLLSKQSTEPTPPRVLISDIPVDLSALCVALLKPDPAARVTGEEVLRLALGGKAFETDSMRSRQVTALTRGVPFVGREAEQLALRATFAEVESSGRMAAVYLHGESGVGKTALVHELTDHVEANHERTLVLRGRCYERETVPYKAFDGVVDSLTRFLRSLSDTQCSALLPRRAQALPMVFPVLGRIKSITMQIGPRFTDADRATLRAQALSALRELFERIADHYRLVVVIDDLQWADAESLALLIELSRPPDAPGFMLIVTARDPEECPPDVRAALDVVLEHALVSQRLRLEGLPSADATRLARALLENGETMSQVDPEQIAREAHGHPLFIDALVRYSQQVRLTQGTRLELDDALRFRIGQLEPDQRHLLELISVAGAPLSQRVLADAAGAPLARVSTDIAKLRVVKLVRTSRARQVETVESFHDRIRQATVSRLSAAERARQHRRLAEAIEASDVIDVEAAAFHWREAGVKPKAALFSARAADRAMENLAFDKAARLYREVLELEPARRSQVQVKLADALSNAGRGREAAEAYLEALKAAAPEQHNELRRRAAQQLLGSGNIDAGIKVATELLLALGVELPKTQFAALMSLLYQRLKLRIRGLGFNESDSTEVPEEQLLRVDTLWSMAALGMVDHVRGSELHTRHVLWALDTGEPYRVSRALSMETWLRASTGDSMLKAPNPLPMQLAEKCQHPHAIALAHLAAGVEAYNSGHLTQCKQRSDAAEGLLRERCTGVAWEITNARLFGSLACLFTADFVSLRQRMGAALREARERGDIYAQTNLTTAVGYMVDVADGNPELALERVNEAMAAWSQQGFYIQHFLAMLARGQIMLSTGRAAEAVKEIDDAWPRMESSHLLRAETVKLYSRWLRARAYSALAKQDASQQGRLAIALQDAKQMAKEHNVLAPGLAQSVRAAVAHAQGKDAQAFALLSEAGKSLAALDMNLGALGCEWAASRVTGGDAGRAGEERVLTECRRRGMQDPTAVLRVYWSF